MPTAEGLYYEEAGQGEPLLMVMGLGTDHLGWILQVPEFSKHYRVITFDNRDVGQSKQADGPYQVADMAQDALALADHLELDTFHLVGMSLGGAIAQEMALQAQDRLRTLTLVVTFAGGGPWAAERARLWSEIRGLIGPDTHLDWLLLFGMSEQFYANPDAVAYSKQLMRANPHPQSVEAFQRQVEAGGRHEARDRLGQITVPTHVIGAEHDTLVPVWKSKEIAELIPGADYSIMPGAPHALNMERAQEFNELVLDWLRSAGPGVPVDRAGQQHVAAERPA
jgi:3-oxoadipate enol-lactonase